MSESIRAKADRKRFERIVNSKVERIHYINHAHQYVRDLAPDGSSKELDALVDAGITLELAFDHMVWGE